MNLWKEEPSYYGGDVLHQAKKEKIQAAMAENGLDVILLLKAETADKKRVPDPFDIDGEQGEGREPGEADGAALGDGQLCG